MDLAGKERFLQRGVQFGEVVRNRSAHRGSSEGFQYFTSVAAVADNMKGQLIVVDLGPSRPAFKVGNLGLGRIPVSSGCSPCFRVSVSPWRNEIAKDSDSDPFSRHGLLTSPETSGRGEHCE